LRRPWLAATAIILAGITTSYSATAAETGDIARLRAEALELVNRTRSEQGLGTLEPDESLDAAAQAHAQDMLERGYYAHVSPDGSTVQDRYRAQGGSRWKIVAENLARCEGCRTPPTLERLRGFHEGWMESPGHRENILRKGLRSFGFGIVAGENKIYAVQTFAGPGSPSPSEQGEKTAPLSPEEQAARALDAINSAREAEGLDPLARSEALDRVANRILAEGDSGSGAIGTPRSIPALLPADEARAWRGISTVAARCGGCGTAPTAADIRRFSDQWLESSRYRNTLLGPGASHLGFAMRATGDGRKTAVAVVGRRR